MLREMRDRDREREKEGEVKIEKTKTDLIDSGREPIRRLRDRNAKCCFSFFFPEGRVNDGRMKSVIVHG